ncbi:MAG: hypothetical protein J6J36_00780 [Clostridia bacterium]|nr:hypothetical protein [Clostridia bacterium]
MEKEKICLICPICGKEMIRVDGEYICLSESHACYKISEGTASCFSSKPVTEEEVYCIMKESEKDLLENN